MMKITDTLIVYGARCTWWEDIKQASKKRMIPTCPHCESPLFQMQPSTWADATMQYDLNNPGYEAMIEWARGKCFLNTESLKKAYEESKEQG